MDNDGGEDSRKRGVEASPLAEFAKFARQVARECASAVQAERLHFESQSLVRWAEHSGWLLDSAAFQRLTAKMRCFEGGAEQNVFFKADASRVIKVTKPPFFGLRSFLKEYANNALWANFLFEDDIQFEGVLAVEQGVSVVVSQPAIEGGAASIGQIASWFEKQGYVPDGFHG